MTMADRQNLFAILDHLKAIMKTLPDSFERDQLQDAYKGIDTAIQNYNRSCLDAYSQALTMLKRIREERAIRQ